MKHQTNLLGNTLNQRDAILKSNGFESYESYLKSPLWRDIKRRAFKVTGKKCCVCGEKANVLHHDVYSEDCLMGRDLKPLRQICDGCHTRIHRHADGRFRTLIETSKMLNGLLNGTPIQEHRPKKPKRKKRTFPKCNTCQNYAKQGESLCGLCKRMNGLSIEGGEVKQQAEPPTIERPKKAPKHGKGKSRQAMNERLREENRLIRERAKNMVKAQQEKRQQKQDAELPSKPLAAFIEKRSSLYEHKYQKKRRLKLLSKI